MLGDLGFAPHIIRVVLGHAHIAEGATAVYALSRYRQEHAEALQTLANEMDRLVAGETNVIVLKGQRDPNRTHPRIDETVKLPRQVQLAVERIDDLYAGRPARPVEVNAASVNSGCSYTDAKAQSPRKSSGWITRRLNALLQVFRELPSELQQHPTGQRTIERLRDVLIERLGLRDDDNVLSEDTIRKDIAQVRPLIRLVQRGQNATTWPAPK